jgi:hypothetical protein
MVMKTSGPKIMISFDAKYAFRFVRARANRHRIQNTSTGYFSKVYGSSPLRARTTSLRMITGTEKTKK